MIIIAEVLVTGANGYIGSHLVKRLLLDGHNVYIIIRANSNTASLKEVLDNVTIFIWENNPEELVRFFSIHCFEIVFHLVACYVASETISDIDVLIDSNICFGTYILHAAALTKVKYFINTGSYAQNYNGEHYNPVNLYAASKQAFIDIARYYIETSDIRFFTIKLFDTFGEFDPRNKIISVFNRIAQTGEELPMSSGQQEMALVYIEDVIKGFMSAWQQARKLKAHESSECVLLPPKVYTLNEVAEIYQKVSGKKLSLKWGERPHRHREAMKIRVKGLKLLQPLEFYSLEDGIKKMIEIENNEESR